MCEWMSFDKCHPPVTSYEELKSSQRPLPTILMFSEYENGATDYGMGWCSDSGQFLEEDDGRLCSLPNVTRFMVIEPPAPEVEKV